MSRKRRGKESGEFHEAKCRSGERGERSWRDSGICVRR
jgi:hypothetical protein